MSLRRMLDFARRLFGFHRVRPESRTTPSGLLGYSAKFLEAAEGAVPGWRDPLPGKRDAFRSTYPLCEYLIGHAIELALKAYLMASGVPEEHLKYRYGHDILRLMKVARKHGLDNLLTLDKQQVEVVRRLAGPYKRKELEYHGVGNALKESLDRGPLIGTADALARNPGIRQFCLDATKRQRGMQ